MIKKGFRVLLEKKWLGLIMMMGCFSAMSVQAETLPPSATTTAISNPNKTIEANEANQNSSQPAQSPQTVIAPDVDTLLTEYYNLKPVDPEKAFTVIQKIVALYPKNLEAHTEYGYLLFNKKQFNEALQQFQIAEQLSPQNYEIKMQMGYTFMNLSQREKAVDKFKEVVSSASDPNLVKEAQEALSTQGISNLGQRQKAYYKFKQIAASSSKPRTVKEAKNGMQSNSSTSASVTAKSTSDTLLDRYYTLKKKGPAQAEIVLQQIITQYPTNLEAQKEYGYLLVEQKRYKEALQHFLIAERLAPNDYEVKIAIAYTLNDLSCNRQAYFKFWEISLTATDPKIVQEAREGMISLAGYQTRVLPQPFFADLYLSPYYMTRFHDTIYYGQARAGVQFGSYNQLQLYVTSYLNQDTASAGGIAPAIYNDNSIIYDVGARYTPYQDSPFFFYIEGGKAHNLILDESRTNRWTNDFRGGINLYKDWGMGPEYVGCIKFPFKQVGNVYGDLSYYSRYNRDWIGQLRLREGLRVLQYHYSVLDVFLQLEAFADTQRDFFNNVVDFGPGITFIPDVRWGVALRTVALRNRYIHVNSPTPNPYGKYFNNFLFQVEAYFGF